MKDQLIGAEVKKRFEELSDEFLDHRDEVFMRNPTTDSGTIFEGWAMQKIAGLQYLVTDLASKVRKLESNK